MGVDPLHFGLIMVVNLTIGLCTPPVGVNLFIATRLVSSCKKFRIEFVSCVPLISRFFQPKGRAVSLYAFWNAFI
jgi:TRAP-type C4-dicarboxylate transport system permease large subunit